MFGVKKQVEESDKIIKGGKTHTETLDENLIHAIAEVDNSIFLGFKQLIT
jgi:hypothetical protein